MTRRPKPFDVSQRHSNAVQRSRARPRFFALLEGNEHVA
jgi:hypothetical protein